MASENETIEDLAQLLRRRNNDVDENFDDWNIADRIEAAHMREVSALEAERDNWRKQALEEDDSFGVVVSRMIAERGESARLGHWNIVNLIDRLQNGEDSNGSKVSFRNCDLHTSRESAFDVYVRSLPPEDRHDFEHGAGDYDDSYNVQQRFIDWLFEDSKKC